MYASGNTPVGTIVGAVVGSVFGVLLIAIAAFVIWKKRKGSKPYYYKSATVYEALSDEFDSEKTKPKQDSVASAVTPNPSYPSSVHSSNNGNRTPSSLFSPQSYFPLPSEYKSQKLLAKSDSTRSKSSTSSSDDSPAHEQRPLL